MNKNYGIIVILQSINCIVIEYREHKLCLYFNVFVTLTCPFAININIHVLSTHTTVGAVATGTHQ
jgi:hypothetical protein